jgi:uncharacterized protein
LVECQENLLTAVGIEVAGDPVSVLYSAGVPVRFGRPT